MIKTSSNGLKTKFAFSLAAALAMASSQMTRADSIQAVLHEEAPRIMRFIRDHGYHTVGVLKFKVKKGAQAESMDAGTLNSMMVASVEHALILLNDPAKPISIIHDAGRTAVGQSRGATFRNAKGRRELFGRAYSQAWDGIKKHADAFLTGEVLVDKSMKTLTLVVQAFDAKRPEVIEEVLRVKNVPTTRSVLASIGQSFVLPRRLVNRGAREFDEAAAADASERDETSSNPLQDADDPVKLEIFYDGTPVTLESDAGSPGEVRVKGSKAADPKEGQKVKFVVSNVGKETIGVVLAVNGKSTLFLEDLSSKPPGECTKWILAPGEVYTIEGFYMSEDGTDVRAFKVLSDDDSAKADLAPEQKGVFSLFAFRPVAEGAAKSLNITADAGDLSRSPKKHAGTRSLTELQAALRAANHTYARDGRLVAERVPRQPIRAHRATQKGGRGLVVEDTQSSTGSTINRVDTQFDPEPAVSLSIRYYSGPTPASL